MTLEQARFVMDVLGQLWPRLPFPSEIVDDTEDGFGVVVPDPGGSNWSERHLIADAVGFADYVTVLLYQ